MVRRRTFPRDGSRFFGVPRPPSQQWPKKSSVPSTQFAGSRQDRMKLEMGDTDGPAVVCLKEELEKARNAAKRRPLQQEVEECRKFITEKRLRVGRRTIIRDEGTRRGERIWCGWKPSRQKSPRWSHPPSILCCSRGDGSPGLCSGKCSRPYLS